MKVCTQQSCKREAAPNRKCCSECLAYWVKYDRKRNRTLKRTVYKQIQNAKISDRKKGYKLDELKDYISVEFMLGEWKRSEKCHYDNCKVQMQYASCILPNGMTIERLTNKGPHTKGNCVLACHRCNCKHNNKLV